jgi:tetratricopeptide (TPR) repeat protein
LNSYRDAEKYSPDDSKKNILEFNKGNAEFRMNNHEAALGRFRNSMNSGDPEVQKKALFNEGTTYMKMGKKKEAAESFIKALQIDPSYQKAKKNLEYLLKDKPQDKQQKSNDDQNSGNGKGEQKKRRFRQ